MYGREKYLLGFCFAAVTGVAALLIGILKVQVTGNQEMQDLLISAGVSMILAGMILCGTIPLRLKYEAEKKQNHHGSGSSGTFFCWWRYAGKGTIYIRKVL